MPITRSSTFDLFNCLAIIPPSLTTTMPETPRAPLAKATATEDTTQARASNRARFELELEFVQALANPFYLQSLAQQNILSQPTFINFLDYLRYWKEKEYAKFLQYVQSLLCLYRRHVNSSLVATRKRSITSTSCKMHSSGRRSGRTNGGNI
jgi:hypothetical protein